MLKCFIFCCVLGFSAIALAEVREIRGPTGWTIRMMTPNYGTQIIVEPAPKVVTKIERRTQYVPVPIYMPTYYPRWFDLKYQRWHHDMYFHGR